MFHIYTYRTIYCLSSQVGDASVMASNSRLDSAFLQHVEKLNLNFYREHLSRVLGFAARSLRSQKLLQ